MRSTTRLFIAVLAAALLLLSKTAAEARDVGPGWASARTENFLVV